MATLKEEGILRFCFASFVELWRGDTLFWEDYSQVSNVRNQVLTSKETMSGSLLMQCIISNTQLVSGLSDELSNFKCDFVKVYF